MQTTGEIRRHNLERLVAELGTLEAVAARANSTSVYLSQIRKQALDKETGRPREMGSAMARRLEKGCGKPSGWMDQPVTDEHLNEVSTSAAAPLPTLRPEEEIEILQYDTGGKMGPGIVLHDQPGVIKRWGVTPEWLQQNVHRITSPKNLAIVTGFGDSMRPLFNPGDPLLIDCDVLRVDADGVYFFRVGEEGFVKRLQRIPTVNGMVIRARSENSNYESFDIVNGMDFEVFGRIVKVWRGDEF